MSTFNLFMNSGFPSIVETDENGNTPKNLPFGIAVKDMPFSDDMRWHAVTPDASGSKRDVYNVLINHDLTLYILDPKSVAPNSITQARNITCHVYYLDGTTKSFQISKETRA